MLRIIRVGNYIKYHLKSIFLNLHDYYNTELVSQINVA